MTWNINQPQNTSWINNSTGSSVGATALKVGTSDVQGIRINDNKKLFFGNDNDFNMRFDTSNAKFALTYTNPVTGVNTEILSYNHFSDTTKIRNLELTNIVLDESSANNQGIPSATPIEGAIVYTEDANNIGKFYIGLGDSMGQSPTP